MTKKYVQYSVRQNRAFMILLALSSFCSGIIYVGAGRLMGFVTIFCYFLLWLLWVAKGAWFIRD